MGLIRSVPTTSQILDDTEAQAQCRVDSDDDLALVQLYRAAAEDAIRIYLGRSLLTETWILTLDDFPGSRDPYYYTRQGEIQIPVLPCSAVTKIEYFTPAGADTELDPALYIVDLSTKPARILPAPLQYWPEVQVGRPSGCRVTFTAGYSTAAAVPPAIRAGIMLLIGSLYANREETVTGTIVARLDDLMGTLLNKYKIPRPT